MSYQSSALAAALTQLGVPYVFGGESPKGSAHPGFDCSGLTQWAYLQTGIYSLTHSSSEQYAAGPKVASPEPGDLVFFVGVSGPPYPGHCGICYTAPVNGIGQMVQAEETGTNVMISEFSMLNDQWVGATRPTYVPPPWPGVLFRFPPYTTAPSVVEWQRRMNRPWGYHLTVDSTYGPICKIACEDFQTKHPPLVVDGIVGPLTWSATFAAPPNE